MQYTPELEYRDLQSVTSFLRVRYIDPSIPVGQADQTRIRIMVAAWAYAYEIMDEPMVTDEIFDTVCKLVDRSLPTGSVIEDEFFRTQFDPSTGMWIHEHPNPIGLKLYYQAWEMWNKPQFKTLNVFT